MSKLFAILLRHAWLSYIIILTDKQNYFQIRI